MKIMETNKPGSVDPADELDWDIDDDEWFLTAVGQGIEELEESGPEELELV